MQHTENARETQRNKRTEQIEQIIDACIEGMDDIQKDAIKSMQLMSEIKDTGTSLNETIMNVSYVYDYSRIHLNSIITEAKSKLQKLRLNDEQMLQISSTLNTHKHLVLDNINSQIQSTNKILNEYKMLDSKQQTQKTICKIVRLRINAMELLANLKNSAQCIIQEILNEQRSSLTNKKELIDNIVEQFNSRIQTMVDHTWSQIHELLPQIIEPYYRQCTETSTSKYLNLEKLKLSNPLDAQAQIGAVAERDAARQLNEAKKQEEIIAKIKNLQSNTIQMLEELKDSTQDIINDIYKNQDNSQYTLAENAIEIIMEILKEFNSSASTIFIHAKEQINQLLLQLTPPDESIRKRVEYELTLQFVKIKNPLNASTQLRLKQIELGKKQAAITAYQSSYQEDIATSSTTPENMSRTHQEPIIPSPRHQGHTPTHQESITTPIGLRTQNNSHSRISETDQLLLLELKKIHMATMANLDKITKQIETEGYIQDINEIVNKNNDINSLKELQTLVFEIIDCKRSQIDGSIIPLDRFLNNLLTSNSNSMDKTSIFSNPIYLEGCEMFENTMAMRRAILEPLYQLPGQIQFKISSLSTMSDLQRSSALSLDPVDLEEDLLTSRSDSVSLWELESNMSPNNNSYRSPVPQLSRYLEEPVLSENSQTIFPLPLALSQQAQEIIAPQSQAITARQAQATTARQTRQPEVLPNQEPQARQAEVLSIQEALARRAEVIATLEAEAQLAVQRAQTLAAAQRQRIINKFIQDCNNNPSSASDSLRQEGSQKILKEYLLDTNNEPDIQQLIKSIWENGNNKRDKDYRTLLANILKVNKDLESAVIILAHKQHRRR